MLWWPILLKRISKISKCLSRGEKNAHGVMCQEGPKWMRFDLYGKQTTLFLKNKQDHAFQGFQGTVATYTNLDFLSIFQPTNRILRIIPPWCDPYKGVFNNYLDRISPFFDPLPPSTWTFFILWAWTKTDIFWPPLPSSCPRSYQMAPYVSAKLACNNLKINRSM